MNLKNLPINVLVNIFINNISSDRNNKAPFRGLLCRFVSLRFYILLIYNSLNFSEMSPLGDIYVARSYFFINLCTCLLLNPIFSATTAVL